MRDRETIDSELRLIALRRQAVRDKGGQPPSHDVDELLDERLGHRAEPSETKSACDVTGDAKPHRRKGVLHRFGPLAMLPLSLLAVVAAFIAMSGRHNEQAAEPAEDPPPSISQSKTAVPQAQAPPLGITDRVFVDVLKKDGVPVPNDEYATTQAHAVCGFLERQPNLADAVRFVQQTSIWDADQSAHFAAGAVVSYCPQYEFATPPIQPGLPSSLSDLQAIQRDMQGINNDLQNIRDHLPAFPGGQ